MTKQQIEIPIKIIRQYIVEELRQRRNAMMEGMQEYAEKEFKEIGYNSDYTLSLATEANGVGVLSDDVEEGIMSVEEALDCLTEYEKKVIYDKCKKWYENKEKIKTILTETDVVKSINENMDFLLKEIPEIKPMIGFEHKHPHHHLDVWEHTLEVIKNLNTRDFELNMAGLLHDIGKPFSYQDEEVRHFHGHPEVSAQMSEKILDRLGFNKEFKNNVIYLVSTHDTVIEPNNLDNTLEMVKKRLLLQYADAKAHKLDKVGKRIALLDKINEGLEKLEELEK